MADVRKGPIWATLLIYIVMGIFTIMAIYPIFWLIVQSFKTTQEYITSSKLAFPKQWYIANYPYAWSMAKLGGMIINSVFYTFLSVGLVILLGTAAGFAFARIPFKVTPLLHGMFIVGILLTLQSIMVPLFLMTNAVGLYDTRLGVLIPYIGLGLPMAVYLSTEFCKSIPSALVESARMDGAKYLRIFISIVFPMLAPVAMTIGIMNFSGTWNEFMLINILTSSDTIKSLPVGINKFAGALATDYGKQFSALVIGMVPMVAFYLIFRKQITKGVAAGAVKG
ncbi:MAG: carbohydrate ABC transporter permease [Treponema sp.]|jgi:raffinose/stachyose/melibiose transport system permease protein|nr:carbohydrate ABC transporter permease [Treponema sp.]